MFACRWNRKIFANSQNNIYHKVGSGLSSCYVGKSCILKFTNLRRFMKLLNFNFQWGFEKKKLSQTVIFCLFILKLNFMLQYKDFELNFRRNLSKVIKIIMARKRFALFKINQLKSILIKTEINFYSSNRQKKKRT